MARVKMIKYDGQGKLKMIKYDVQGKLTTSTEANMTEDRGPRARWCR